MSCAVIVPGALTDEEAAQAFAPVVLNVRDGAPLKLSVEQIKRMTWSELSRLWKVIAHIYPLHLLSLVSKCLAGCGDVFHVANSEFSNTPKIVLPGVY